MSETVWEELLSQAISQNSNGILKRLVGVSKPCPLFFGVLIPSRTFCIVLELPRESLDQFENLEESKGFSVVGFISSDELNSDHSSLIVSASSEAHNEIFRTIADDILSAINAALDEQSKARALYNRILLWQKFFEKQSALGLSPNAQQGLYGELYFLFHHLLKSTMPVRKAIDSWTGPQKRQHDFQFGSYAVEVKTVSQRTHTSAQITSEQQLDESQIEKLYLFCLSVSIIQNGDNTLPQLVSKIREALSVKPACLSKFENTLLESGYSDAHAHLYDDRSYSVRAEEFFHVTDTFPRIKESELRNGVGSVSYSISISACKGFEFTAKKMKKILEECAM